MRQPETKARSPRPLRHPGLAAPPSVDCSVTCPTDAEAPPLSHAPLAGEALFPAWNALSRAERIRELRRRIATVAARERPEPHGRSPAWSLGAAACDALLGEAGLAIGGVHELKPTLSYAADAKEDEAGTARTRRRDPHGVRAGDRAAAVVFALALARRRLGEQAMRSGPPRVLWCAPRRDSREIGRLYAPGLAAFGLAPERLMQIDTRHDDETLWVLEEGLRSGGLMLTVAFVDDVALTPARRLALAAEQHRTPCLLLTGARAPPAAATVTRWRIGRAASAPHAFDADAPGAPRLAVALERCRGQPLAAERSFILDWSDEAFCFSVAAGLAGRTDAPGRTSADRLGAGSGARRGGVRLAG